jgi:hypothetical protein
MELTRCCLRTAGCLASPVRHWQGSGGRGREAEATAARLAARWARPLPVWLYPTLYHLRRGGHLAGLTGSIKIRCKGFSSSNHSHKEKKEKKKEKKKQQQQQLLSLLLLLRRRCLLFHLAKQAAEAYGGERNPKSQKEVRPRRWLSCRCCRSVPEVGNGLVRLLRQLRHNSAKVEAWRQMGGQAQTTCL